MYHSIWLKRLVIFAAFLACVVVALGAYTRLKDAGLGCPDWPGCYGFISVPDAHHEIEAANSAYPHRPVEAHKAWPEMIHRYFASTLGLVILIIAGLSIAARRKNPQYPLKLPLFLLGLVIFQGLLGMWTVTLGLFPTVVMGHLLGGFTTLSLIFLLALRYFDIRPEPLQHPALFKFTIFGIVILALQIALGGWTAANYAATICTDLPICQSGWQEHLNFGQAFKFWGHGVTDYEFGIHLGPDSKITIHVMHRIGAIVTTLYLAGLLSWILFKLGHPLISKIAITALLILALQVGLGVSNILFNLPLAVAVAHNGVAALLMLSLISISYCLYKAGKNRA